MSKRNNLKAFPVHKTDQEAENFTDTADLSEYDFSGFTPVGFEFQKKEARVNMRLPQSQLDTLKREAEKRGLPYQRFMRDLLERGLQSLRHRPGPTGRDCS